MSDMTEYEKQAIHELRAIRADLHNATGRLCLVISMATLFLIAFIMGKA